MKSFKNMLVIAALFAIGSISAKRTGAAVATKPTITTPTQPAVTTTPIKPTPLPETKGIYAEILEQIENDTIALIDANNRATDNIKNKINKANLTHDLKLELVDVAEKMQDGLTTNSSNNKKKISSLRPFLKALPEKPLKMEELFGNK